MFKRIVVFGQTTLAPTAILALTACAAGPSPQVELVSIRFGGPDKLAVQLDGYGIVTGDDWAADERFMTSNPHLAPSTPDDYRERGAPLAFNNGAEPRLTAVVSVDQELDENLVLTATGRLPDGTELVWRGAVVPGPGEQEIDFTSDALPDGPYCGELVIDWTIADPKGTEELLFSEQPQHDLYISRAEPSPHATLNHTALQMSCAAVGTTTEEEALDAIWAAFATNDVRRARDDARLFYYEARDASAWVQGLLLSQHGECHSWVQLMGHTLAFHGIAARQVTIAPKRPSVVMQVGSWTHLRGTHFVGTGPDGLCDTAAVGDDEQPIAVGHGRPHTVAVDRPAPAYPSFGGDDGEWSWGWAVSGPNGVADTPAEDLAPNWAPVVPMGRGLSNGRAYYVATDPASITLEGDDIIYDSFLLTGADGLLQTPPQDGLTDDYYTEPIEVGNGYSATYDNMLMAIPIAKIDEASTASGDDDVHFFGITTGEDGISESSASGADIQLIPEGQGEPNVACIGPGSDGVLNTTPAGDDTVLDHSKYFGDREPEGALIFLTAWPDAPLEAQGGEHSPRIFGSHILLQAGGKIYDPGYGAGPFANTDVWTQERLSSTSVNTGIELNGRFVGETFPPRVGIGFGPIQP
ncbi:MAG: hypothetical protein AB8H79_14550 [Myxococcota bacterium]